MLGCLIGNVCFLFERAWFKVLCVCVFWCLISDSKCVRFLGPGAWIPGYFSKNCYSCKGLVISSYGAYSFESFNLSQGDSTFSIFFNVLDG